MTSELLLCAICERLFVIEKALPITMEKLHAGSPGRVERPLRLVDPTGVHRCAIPRRRFN